MVGTAMVGAAMVGAAMVGAAMVGAVLTALVVGLPTDVEPNPVFGRAVLVTWWSHLLLLVVSVPTGLLLARM
ncbi:MAG: hypothetical protein ACYDC9_05600 [Dermatophilaceae bacterium]